MTTVSKPADWDSRFINLVPQGDKALARTSIVVDRKLYDIAAKHVMDKLLAEREKILAMPEATLWTWRTPSRFATGNQVNFTIGERKLLWCLLFLGPAQTETERAKRLDMIQVLRDNGIVPVMDRIMAAFPGSFTVEIIDYVTHLKWRPAATIAKKKTCDGSCYWRGSATHVKNPHRAQDREICPSCGEATCQCPMVSDCTCRACLESASALTPGDQFYGRWIVDACESGDLELFTEAVDALKTVDAFWTPAYFFSLFSRIPDAWRMVLLHREIPLQGNVAFWEALSPEVKDKALRVCGMATLRGAIRARVLSVISYLLKELAERDDIEFRLEITQEEWRELKDPIRELLLQYM